MKPAALMRTALITLCVSVLLAVVFGVGYMNDRAWGAWGDDSAGYIALAGRLYAELPLVRTDALGAEGLNFFGDERLARWLIPTHDQFINPEGTIASKYPIGLSMLMVVAAKLVGSDTGFYLVNPIFAAANVVLLYLLAVCVFAAYKWRHVVGVVAGVSMGLSSVYYDYALAQPMREIPSITFLLLTALCLWAVKTHWGNNRRWVVLGTLLAGFFYGMAVNVRETSLVLLPAIVVFVWMVTKTTSWKAHLRKLLPYAGLFIITLVIALLPTIQNSIAISEQKVVFKPRDTSSVVLLSNIGHVQTLSLQNVFNNQGKFRPGTGALPDYWDVIRHASPIHFFIVLVGIGWVVAWRQTPATAIYLALWAVSILGIFSLWVNPYSRYVLPLFPPLMLLGAYGLLHTVTTIIPHMWKSRVPRFIATLCLVLLVGAAYYPVVIQAKANYDAETHVFKAVSQSDLEALKQLGDSVGTGPKSVVMFSGIWQYGTSETFEAHTRVKAIRFPLDQRFTFDPEQVDAFFDQMLSEGYDVSIWIDSTSSPEALQWLSKHTVTTLFTHDFSFQPDVHVYQVQP